MANAKPSSGSASRYRFLRPGGAELETALLSGDKAAEARAEELSRAQRTAVVIERHDLVDWEYVTEVDKRP